MENIKQYLLNVLTKITKNENYDLSSLHYQNLIGLKLDLEKGVNEHTVRSEKGENIREIQPADLPLYTTKVLSNTFLLGIDISKYSADFKGIIEDLKGLDLQSDREVYKPVGNETIEQNHERISSAFKTCSEIIANNNINATFTGSLALYTKLGVESGRNHSDVDFYIDEKNIYTFLKALKESGQKFEFEDKRLHQTEGIFANGKILPYNGGTGGGHQCQVKLLDPNAPNGYTEIGFFLTRQVQTQNGIQTDFVKYYLDRQGETETPIVVGRQIPNNVSTNVDVHLDKGSVASVQAHTLEYNLHFKLGTPKSATKNVEDILLFTQNSNLQNYQTMLNKISSIDKNNYQLFESFDKYPKFDDEGKTIDQRTDTEKITDSIFETSEQIVVLKQKLNSADETEKLMINEQISSLQGSINYYYSQIDTQDLISGVNDKMQIYSDRLSMAIPLDGFQRQEHLTNENLDVLEQDFALKQLASQELFKTLDLEKENSFDNNMDEN